MKFFSLPVPLLAILFGGPLLAQDPELPPPVEPEDEPLPGYFFDESELDSSLEIPEEGEIPTLEDGYGYDYDYDSESPFDDRFSRASLSEERPVYGDGWKIWRLDGVLPPGLQRGQIVDVGRFGVSVRYSQTEWDEQRDGTDDLSSEELFSRGYQLAATNLEEQRIELDLVYGLDDRWTLYGTVPFIDRELEYDIDTGGSAVSDNSGIGDVILGGRYTARANDQELLSYFVGLGLPTGSHDERGNYAGDSNAYLPFNLQLGSGTFDLHPGVSYVRMLDTWSVGVRGEAQVHLERNSDNWAVGDTFQLNAWAAKALSRSLTGNVGLQADWRGDYLGDENELDFSRSSIEDVTRQRGSVVSLVLGIAADFSRSYAGANRLGLEVQLPLVDRVDGPNLARETTFLVSWNIGL